MSSGLVVEAEHQEQLYNGGFDGMYTYFASDTFVYGSMPSKWSKISTYCKTRQLMFSPSVGPGYIDTEVSVLADYRLTIKITHVVSLWN